MSTLKVGAIRGVSASSDAITVANDGTCTGNITNNLSNRNLVINGSQIIDQRNSGSAVTVSNATKTYVTDRFSFYEDTDGVISAQQSTTSPDGFTKSIKVDCTTADTSLSANQRLVYEHRIEGNNIAHLGFGSSAAKTITLSFYVRSNLTGTFGGSIKNDSSNRVYVFSYVINSANTWERKTITIPGDTSGTWETDTTAGININWGLALGSNWTGAAGSYGTSDKHGVTGQLNLLSSTDNEWLITGVQLEVGSHATDFEHRSLTQELALCQRYYYKHAEGASKDMGVGAYYTATLFAFSIKFPVTMRAAPTLDYVSGTNYYQIFHNNTNDLFDAFAITRNQENCAAFDSSTGTSGVQGSGGILNTANASSYVALNAEL